ncbi:hypothetical protein [Apilactobacillus micheneri]|uniref:Uncharacterized protein n=1 Tax=Apilactobacillus micheneri TaxID=1899430 RepID=A0A9Q8INF8_9LACO|nr:hypothetical protein [Apilactobacillus micheneri]TPR39941.1 hypothetical protein DY121_03650 [Apilactobacillus micheneri]TPR41754.1 hypothetical protein DY123_04280 [Apilactobacillus micheneri]TPR43358.1 hypothetical protein DY124_05595 [Apilactobacillus micheneri]TPR44143.1 hypothetical protein DY130_03645 [Apilactobacillus micheneri]TPR45767.1 hypothetical protein DY128_03645 [Apilactobacillus micheneri]
MKIVTLGNFQFEYDPQNIYCFADNHNQRIAFITPREINVVIDIVDGNLTFHPDRAVDIIELDTHKYRVVSYY